MSANNGKSAPERRVRVAFVGLGERGRSALRLMLPVQGAEVVALCDISADSLRAVRAQQPEVADVRCFAGPEAYKEVCRQPDVELVYICSDWMSHPLIAIEAMRCGKDVAIEVPAATTMEEIRQLVCTQQQTQRRCFLLENACFERQTMDALAAIRRGELGEIVHAEGNYYHCLDDRWAAWRLETNRQRRGDLYPTHALGPICQALDIGRSDELQTLVCMDSAPFTGPSLYEQRTGRPAADFQNGDHTTTLIRTRRGRTIVLRHDVLTPQPYDRRLLFIGTRGRLELCDTGRPSHDEMTLQMNRHLIHSLTHHVPFGIDIRDLATWCCVIPLSEESIRRGYAAVSFPKLF